MSVTPQTLIAFGTPFNGDFFTLDDPVKGVLDNTDYPLSGDVPVDVSDRVLSVSIERGRSSEFDEFTPGTATVVLRNNDRLFDPEYTAGPYYGNLTRGKRAQILNSSGIALITGTTDDWSLNHPLGGLSTATVTITDGLALLAGSDMAAWTATGGQTVGARITDVLNRAEVAYPATRNIGTGIATLTNDTIADGTNTLAYLQTLEDAELGRFFDSAAGVITFRDRWYVPTNLSTSTIVTTGIAPFEINRVNPKDTVRNYVKVALTTGAVEEVFSTSSINEYGIHSLTLDNLPLADTTQAADLADFLAASYATPATRFSQLRFKLHGLTQVAADALCRLDISDPLEVIFTPDGVGDPLDAVCVVEGMRHEFPTSVEHYLTLNVSRALQTSMFILDDPVYGVLDGPGLLAF